MYRVLQHEPFVEVTPDGAILHCRNGETIEFPSDTEAYEYLEDNSCTSPADANTAAQKSTAQYYVYRINKLDKDTSSNYQYYNGRCFRYGADNILRMDKSAAERIVNRRSRYDDYYNYYISK